MKEKNTLVTRNCVRLDGWFRDLKFNKNKKNTNNNDDDDDDDDDVVDDNNPVPIPDRSSKTSRVSYCLIRSDQSLYREGMTMQ